MKPKKTGKPEIHDLHGDGSRYGIVVDGRVQFAGTLAECENRMRAFYGGMDPAAYPALARELQDKALGRAIGRI